MTRLLMQGMALLLLAPLPSQSPAMAKEPTRAAPFASLVNYLTTDDYPAEAVAKGEQGTVAFRLAIGVDGRVHGCTITASSGSAILDTASCRIMVARARFHSATDASGKPVQDIFESKISWRMPQTGHPQDVQARSGVDTATGLWFACASGEAAKLVLTDLSASDIARRAFEGCRLLEERIVAEMTQANVKGVTPSRMITILKEDVLRKLPEFLAKARADLPVRSSTP